MSKFLEDFTVSISFGGRVGIPFALAFILVLFGCAKVYEIDPASPTPSVLTILPECGRSGDTVTVSGKNFSSVATENEMTINGIRAAVIISSDSYLKAIVPTKVGSGPVEVSVKGVSSIGGNLTFISTGLVTTFVDDIYPGGLASDNQGNLYLADGPNNRIVKILPDGSTSVIAGDGAAGFINGAGDDSRFNNPFDVAVDSKGNIYVSDTGNDCIRKITPSGEVTLFAGFYPSPNFNQPINGFKDTLRTYSMFNLPKGIAIDKDDNVYVCDEGNLRIRKISQDNGNSLGAVTTYAGSGESGHKDGEAKQATFTSPTDLAIDNNSNLFVTELQTSKIRKVSNDQLVSTVISDQKTLKDCKNKSVLFQYPNGITVDSAGTLYTSVFINQSSYKIIAISPENNIFILAGGGSNNNQEGLGENVGLPYAGSITTIGEDLFVAGDSKILKVELK